MQLLRRTSDLSNEKLQNIWPRLWQQTDGVICSAVSTLALLLLDRFLRALCRWHMSAVTDDMPHSFISLLRCIRIAHLAVVFHAITMQLLILRILLSWPVPLSQNTSMTRRTSDIHYGFYLLGELLQMGNEQVFGKIWMGCRSEAEVFIDPGRRMGWGVMENERLGAKGHRGVSVVERGGIGEVSVCVYV